MVEIGSGAERQPFLYYNFGGTISDNHLIHYRQIICYNRNILCNKKYYNIE